MALATLQLVDQPCELDGRTLGPAPAPEEGRVGAHPEEQPHRRQLVLVDGEVERRHAVERVPVDVVGVDVGAALDQHAHHVVVAAVGGQVQRGLLVAPELRRPEQCRDLSWWSDNEVSASRA